MRSRRQAAYSYGTNRRPGRRAYVIGKLHCAGDPGTYLWSDSLPEFRQRDASTGALEQAPAALSLQFADPAADMRLARAVGHSHFAEADQLRGGEKEIPTVGVHGLPLIRYTVLAYLTYACCVIP